jgi:hypothetical protein
MKIRNILLATTIFLGISSAAEAASYPSGSSTYRAGGSLNAHEHAGVRKNADYVYEIKGYNYTVQLSSDTSFKGGKTYYGNYSSPSITSTQRDNILATAEALRDNNSLTYTMYDQINWTSSAGDFISVGEITDIRCDGVVEYAYEWNNLWVWGRSSTGTSSGTPTHFDVSYVPYAKEHANLGSNQPWKEVSPKVQRHGNGDLKWTKFRKNY